MRRWWESTIRLRLTAWYAGAFFLAGGALIVLTYLLFGRALDHNLAERVSATERLVQQAHLGEDSPDGAKIAGLHQGLRAQFERDSDATLRTMLTWSLASLGVLGVAAGGCGWLLAGRALRPLQEITATARRVADRSLHERIALDGPDDEIKDLADTFDAMLERLDRSFDGQRRFVAHASHELRTPLTINRTLIEVALDTPEVPEPMRQLGTALLDVNHRHERLIDGLLVLASSDQHLTEHEQVDLANIAAHVTTDDAAHRADIEIHTYISPAQVQGDPVLLERLAQNLVDNAIRYNLPEAGWASITTGTTDGHAYLIVENSGPTVPDEEVDGLFEPFRRSTSGDALTTPDAPGHGAGLGLSIVRSVTHAHYGEVHARARPQGGLTVHVTIPTTQPDQHAPITN